MLLLLLFSAYRVERPLDIHHPQNSALHNRICRELSMIEHHTVYQESADLKLVVTQAKQALSQRDIRLIAKQMNILLGVIKSSYAHNFPELTQNATRWETRHVPAVYGPIKICDGHVESDSCYYGSDARRWCSRQYRQLASCSHIKPGSVSTSYDHCETSVGGFFWSLVNWNYGSSRKGMRAWYTHKDGYSACTNYHLARGLIKEATTKKVAINYQKTIRKAGTRVCHTASFQQACQNVCEQSAQVLTHRKKERMARMTKRWHMKENQEQAIGRARHDISEGVSCG